MVATECVVVQAPPSIEVAAITLRPYQERAIGDSRSGARGEYRRGKKSVLLVAPTGAGKTIMGSFMARSHLDKKGPESLVLVIVPRIELAEQWRSTFERIGLRVSVDVDTADQVHLAGATPQVLVTTVQTLLARKACPLASLIIADEAHHYVSSEWHAVIAPHLARGACILGLTATPCRSDGTALGHLFDAIVPVASVNELVALGFLVACDVIAPPVPKKKKGDGNTVVLAGDPVEAYLEHGRDAAGELRRAIFFARTIKQARAIQADLRARGVPCEAIDCHLRLDVRRARVAAFRDRKIVALVNVAILTEGFDDPSLEVIVLARRIGHIGLYDQIIGRGRRPSPATGKTRMLLIDLGGSRWEHGDPSEDREYSLEGEAVRRVKKKVRRCEGCGVEVKARDLRAEKCMTCGRSLGSGISIVVEAEALTLVAPVAAAKAVSPPRRLAALMREGEERGRAPGWAMHKFRDAFERWPSWREKETAARLMREMAAA